MGCKGYFVYRYVNLDGEITYVGKTENIKNRFMQHKSESMFKECYKVEYIELKNSIDMELYETYFINKCKPKYNSTKIYDGEPNFVVPEQEWKIYFINRKNDIRHSTEIKRCEELFRDINETKFDNELPLPRILLTKAPKSGNFIDDPIKTSAGFQYTIELDESSCFGNVKNIVFSLFHNMCHLYNCIHNIGDTSNQKTYHNVDFKRCVVSHGGYLKRNKYGFWICDVDDELKDIIAKHKTEYDCMNLKRYEEKLVNGRKPSSTRKYICPSCGTSFRATKNIDVICGKCNIRFILDSKYKEFKE